MRIPARPVRLVLTAAIALGVALPACHQQGASQPNSATALARTQARLEGNWTLERFDLERPLEPTLDALLKVQLRAMVVEIRGAQLVARGVGLVVVRRLELFESGGDTFRGRVRDDQGVTYDVLGEFEGDRLVFSSLNDPWRGQGELRRLPETGSAERR
jgi:hypothetical protein